MVSRSSVYRRRLVIFAKSPEMGRVKTRLARDVGLVTATAWYRTTSRRVIADLSRDPRWDTYLAVAPDQASGSYKNWQDIWPETVMRVPQGGGDLGTRLEAVFRWFPPGPILIVGSDIPGLTSGHVASAFKALGHSDAVLGPCQDGGYWGIGLRRLRAETDLFQDVRWSTSDTYSDTLKALQPRRIQSLETLIDVDTGSDLALASAV